MIIACNFRAFQSAEGNFGNAMTDRIKKIHDNMVDINDTLYLDIGGEGQYMFSNIEDRSKKISEALIQLIIQEKKVEDASDFINKSINTLSSKIKNFRPNISIKGQKVNNISCFNCRGIILFGFELGAVLAYMVGDALSRKLNIPISIVAVEPDPSDTNFASKFSNSVYQKVLKLKFDKVSSVTTVLAHYTDGRASNSWISTSSKQMLPESLKEKSNSNIILIRKQNRSLSPKDKEGMLQLWALCLYLFHLQIQKKNIEDINIKLNIYNLNVKSSMCLLSSEMFFDNIHQSFSHQIENNKKYEIKFIDNVIDKDIVKNQKSLYSKKFNCPIKEDVIKILTDSLSDYCKFQFFGWHHHKSIAQWLLKYLQNLYDLENPANRQKSPSRVYYYKKMSLIKRAIERLSKTYDLL